MKFLLVAVNAKFIHTNLAVYSIKSFIERNSGSLCDGRGFVEVSEYTVNQSFSEVLADIYGRKPDVLAFSCYIWNWEMVGRLLLEIKKVLPMVPVWLGGPEVSYDGEGILERFPGVSGVVIGEGERTCLELFEVYCDT